ncbi:hypothetical protein [Corallococcus sp. 4LFB]|uniref:hypothetical protein n=1 Tax=Corallococcus sp. 4LFB TaxID=3383249 RepID=UPI0039755C0C
MDPEEGKVVVPGGCWSDRDVSQPPLIIWICSCSEDRLTKKETVVFASEDFSVQ